MSTMATKSKNKWAAYAAVAGTALTMGAQTAEADIIHVVVGAANGGTLSAAQSAIESYQIAESAFNGGVITFSHYNFSTATSTGNANVAVVGMNMAAGTSTFTYNGNQYTVATPSNLAFGALLSAQQNFVSNYGPLASNYGFAQFNTANPGYLGFSFTDANGDTQHGWARITIENDTINDFTVEEFAYSTAGEALTVGQTSAVPEPGSLGLLALGAIGLATTRRRRSVEPSNN